MVAVHNDTLAITDWTNKKLHFITINQQSLDITKHTTRDLSFKPLGISVDSVADKLVLADYSNNGIVICDNAGNVQKRIPVKTDVQHMRCALAIDGGYVILDCSPQGRVHWVDRAGNVTHTYGQHDGEGLRNPQHMVQDSQGRLVVADTDNNRLHLIGANRQLSQYLLTEKDGIEKPTCVCLDETTGRLFVGHGSSCELSVYKWPTAAPPTADSSTHHTLHLQLGRYK
jgi:DNA-binding beta-propeller fold protein YncE